MRSAEDYLKESGFGKAAKYDFSNEAIACIVRAMKAYAGQALDTAAEVAEAVDVGIGDDCKCVVGKQSILNVKKELR